MKRVRALLPSLGFFLCHCAWEDSGLGSDPNQPPARFSGSVALAGDWAEQLNPKYHYLAGNVDTLSFAGDSVRVVSVSWSDLGSGAAVKSYYRGAYRIDDGVLNLDLWACDSAYTAASASLFGRKLQREWVVEDFNETARRLTVWEKNQTRNFAKFERKKNG